MNLKKTIGITSITGSALFYGSYGVWSRLMIGGFGEFNQAWIRAAILLVILIPFGLFMKSFKSISRSDWKWFAIVSLAGGLNQAPYYFGFKYLEVGSGTLLFYGALTIGLFAIGKLFFGEHITRAKLLSLLLGIFGLLVINGFSIELTQILAVSCVIFAGVMGACAVGFSKKLSNEYSETQILASIFICMLVSNFIISLFISEPVPSSIISLAWFAQLGYTMSQLFSNALAIKGFSLLQPAIAALLGLTEVVFAILMGILIFGEKLTAPIMLGSLLIVSAAALPEIHKMLSHQKLNH